MEEMKKGRVCVTGAGGYVASWLVKLLLSKGYVVNGTVRDPSDKKNSHLKKLEKAHENLQLFKTDLLDYSSIASAVAGCEGVFHVASPVPLSKVANPEVELIAPAVTGTLNVLKACYEAKVKRVIVVSSVGSIIMIPNWPKDRIMDEDCWSDKEYCKTTKSWYCLSKTLAENEALDYAEKHGLNVITLCPSMVIGPLLQPTINASSLFLINMLSGRELILNKSWHFVDVRDVADALLLVYEKPEASGRYICAPHPINIHGLIDMLKSNYPNYDYRKDYTEVEREGGLMTSEKLKVLGWKCRTLEESIADSIAYYQEVGILNNNRNTSHLLSYCMSIITCDRIVNLELFWFVSALYLLSDVLLKFERHLWLCYK